MAYEINPHLGVSMLGVSMFVFSIDNMPVCLAVLLPDLAKETVHYPPI